MPTVNTYNTAREEVGSLDLSDAVFGAEIKPHLFYAVVRYQLAKRRAGTHATKTRAQVSGGGRKPFRQKGTGRARAGTIRAPHWRGGGVVHGPHVRSHAHHLPKKVRRAALRCALSKRLQDQSLTVFEAFTLPQIKTRDFVKILETFAFDDLLLVLPERDETVMRSARNVPGVTVIPVEGLNVYDVLRHKNLALTRDAVAGVVTRLGR
ncbi:MAG: 50S ribosomal protein L4 [Oligoflexia bacterium]|nr:50S ribosomal protein L4 [Oligoflexia bacterium]